MYEYKELLPNEIKELPGLKFFANFQAEGEPKWRQGFLQSDGLFRIQKGNLPGEYLLFLQYTIQPGTFAVFNEDMEAVSPCGPPNGKEVGLANYKLGDYARIMLTDECGMITVMDLSIKIEDAGVRVKSTPIYFGSIGSIGNRGEVLFSALGKLARKMLAGYREIVNGRSGVSPRRIYARAITECAQTA